MASPNLRVIDFSTPTADGEGQWKAGTTVDSGHPNQAGHDLMFGAFDLEDFDPATSEFDSTLDPTSASAACNSAASISASSPPATLTPEPTTTSTAEVVESQEDAGGSDTVLLVWVVFVCLIIFAIITIGGLYGRHRAMLRLLPASPTGAVDVENGSMKGQAMANANNWKSACTSASRGIEARAKVEEPKVDAPAKSAKVVDPSKPANAEEPAQAEAPGAAGAFATAKAPKAEEPVTAEEPATEPVKAKEPAVESWLWRMTLLD